MPLLIIWKKQFHWTETWLRTPTGGRQPFGYLQSVVEFNPGQPETNPDKMLERVFVLHWKSVVNGISRQMRSALPV